MTGRWSRLYVPTLLAQAGVEAGHRVLDVATGTGGVAIVVASRVGASGKLLGSTSRPMLAWPRARSPERPIVLLEMDAQALAFKDDSFDAVVCQLGLMSMRTPPVRSKSVPRPSVAALVSQCASTPPLIATSLRNSDGTSSCTVFLTSVTCCISLPHWPSARFSSDCSRGGPGGRSCGSRRRRVIGSRLSMNIGIRFEAGGGRHRQLYMKLPASVRQEVQSPVRDRMRPYFVKSAWRSHRCRSSVSGSDRPQLCGRQGDDSRWSGPRASRHHSPRPLSADPLGHGRRMPEIVSGRRPRRSISRNHGQRRDR